ncbi:hypothetical protein DIPPA_25762 [Diplonema papillatum]|nr:hypothetical protein DIPPA_25762 [Diplonema papillatum]
MWALFRMPNTASCARCSLTGSQTPLSNAAVNFPSPRTVGSANSEPYVAAGRTAIAASPDLCALEIGKAPNRSASSARWS